MAPLESLRLRSIRRRLLRRARGTVLELGAGTGVNAEHYAPDQLTDVIVTDRDRREAVLSERFAALSAAGVPVRSARMDAERLPLADDSVDTVVATLLFCSVGCVPCGFAEIRRVLRPGGRYLFLEHVRPSSPPMARSFDWLNPVWNRVSRGCNLNRQTLATLEDAGFDIHRMDSGRSEVFVWGEARPR